MGGVTEQMVALQDFHVHRRQAGRCLAATVLNGLGTERREADRGFAAASSGFTLIELIVCIGVVSVLVGLAMPPLARARERARAVASMSNLRTNAGVIGLYIGQYADAFPFGREGFAYDITISGVGVSQRFDHFQLPDMWQVLVRDVAPWDQFWRAWYSPGCRTEAASGVAQQFSYPMSDCFVADHRLWVNSAVPCDGFLHAVRSSDVGCPGSKVLMWDSRLAYLPKKALLAAGLWDLPTPVLFADGHAQEKSPVDASSPVVNVMNRDLADAAIPLSNTRNGVQGTDF